MTQSTFALSEGERATTRGQLLGIQYLRGIAAIMVVIFHLKSQFPRMGFNLWWPGGLSSGVDIFFVISGFIMLVTTSDGRSTFTGFLSKRLIRIAPLYWLVTGFMTAILFLAPQALQTGAYDRWHLISSYIFIPSIHPTQHKFEPLVTPGWTLNYEMFFYVIFGLFLIMPRKLRFAFTAASLCSIVAMGSIFHASEQSILGFYTSSIILEFLFGMVLGEIFLNGAILKRVPIVFGWALLICGLFLLVLPPPFATDLPRAFARGPFAAAVVAGTLIIEEHGGVRDIRVLHALGNASYSIYLTQIIVTSALSQGWRHLGLHEIQGGIVLFALTDVVACATFGWLCYNYVERSLTRLIRSVSIHSRL